MPKNWYEEYLPFEVVLYNFIEKKYRCYFIRFDESWGINEGTTDNKAQGLNKKVLINMLPKAFRRKGERGTCMTDKHPSFVEHTPLRY